MPDMPETKKPTQAEDYEGPLSPAGVAALKFAIVGMGVLIIVGLLLIVGRIIYLASQPKTDSKTARPALTAEATISLPPGARPIRTSVDGSQLSIIYQIQSGQFGVMIVDLQTGQALSNVKIEAKNSTANQSTK